MKYNIHKKEEIYNNQFFKIKKVDISIDTFQKDRRNLIHRYELNCNQVVAVLLKLANTNKFIFVEQFRYSSRKKTNGWMKEIIAGIVNNNENIEIAAKREVLEETGYCVSNLKKLFSFYPNVGFSDQLIHLYFGSVTTKDKIEKGGGLLEENEDIKIHEISIETIKEMIKNKEILDAKTLIACQYYFSQNYNIT